MKKVIKSRVIVLGLILIVLTMSLTTIATAVATPITIKFVTLGGTQSDILDEMVAAFEKENPGIKVEWESWPYEDAYNKYVTVAKAGTPPDCGYAYAIMLPEFVERGVLVPVVDYIPKELKDDYYPGLLEQASYKGKLWALPAWFSTNLINYRKDILDKNGLKIPTTPEEALKVAKALHNPPDLYGASFPGGQTATFAVRWFALQLWGRGGDFLTSDNKKAIFNSKAGVEALKYLTELAPYYQTGYLAQGEHEVARVFDAGKIPWMQWSMGGGLLNPKKDHPDWDLVPAYPPTPKKVCLGIEDVYFLFKTTPEKQKAAWKWLEFTQQAKYTEHTNIVCGYNPTRKSAAQYYMNTDFFKNSPVKEGIKTYIDAANYMKWPPASPKWNDIEQALQDAMQASFTGKLTPQNALDQAAKKVNSVLDEFYQ